MSYNNYPCSSSFAEFVQEYMYLPKSSPVFHPGRGSSLVYKHKKSVFDGVPKFNVLALRIDFSVVS